MSTTQNWHLKKYDDGSVFGPVDVATLHDWASKGEISPYDMLSKDGVKWMAAPELSELAMNWIVEFPDGEMYGPTCIEAIRAFLTDGQLTPDNSIRNAATGEKSLIGEHSDFQDLLAAETENPESATDGTEDGSGPVTSAEESESLRQAVDELEETNQKMQAAHQAAMEQLNQELVTAKTQQQFLRSELDLLKQTTQTDQTSKDASTSEKDAELARIREQFDLLFELNKQLTQNYEESVAKLNRRIQDTLGKIDEHTQREAELNQQVAEAAQREAQYREQINAMEKELVQSQESHATLLGRYSELNDKLMRFLNKSGEQVKSNQ